MEGQRKRKRKAFSPDTGKRFKEQTQERDNIASSSSLSFDSGDSASKGATAKAEKIDGASKMDTTKGIREAPAHVREEYYTTMEELFKPDDVEDRKARVRIFEEQRKAFSPDTEKHFKEQTQEREKIHFDFMGIVFPEAFVDHYKHPLPEGYPVHDHTKDALFAFLLAFLYDILKTPKDERDEELKRKTKPLVDHELSRHYCLEPHHPEHEKKTGNDCSDDNIFEMAIDRLARNVQFNHGEINMDQMRRFLPNFFINDTEGKQKSYMEYMEKYQEFVSRRSKELYFDKE